MTVLYDVAIALGVLVAGILIYVLRSLAKLQQQLRKLDELRDDIRYVRNKQQTVGINWIEIFKIDRELCAAHLRRLRNSLTFYRKLEASTGEDERWKLSRSVDYYLFVFNLVPAEHRLPSKMIELELRLLGRIWREYHCQREDVK